MPETGSRRSAASATGSGGTTLAKTFRPRLAVVLAGAFALLAIVTFAMAALVAGSAVGTATADLADPAVAAAAARAARRSVLLWGVLAALAVLPLGIWMARRVVDPLRRVPKVVRRLDERQREPASRFGIAEVHELTRGVARAATELRNRVDREAHERNQLSALLAAVSEAIVQIGPDGRIVRLNPAARDLLGLPAATENEPVAAVMRNLELRGLFRRAVGGELVQPHDVAIDDRRILVAAAPLEAGGAVVTAVDLTDLRRLEEVRRDFVANASHELKTPLTSIRGYSETLLNEDVPDSERRLFLETIARNADRLQSIVDDLLDLSRLEAGRWKPEPERLDLAVLADACWQTVARRTEKAEVSFAVDDAVPAIVHADRRALEQIFSNLYDNALRYTPDDGHIEVAFRHSRPGEAEPASRKGRGSASESAESAESAGAAGNGAGESRVGKWLAVAVRDNGTGIPGDALPRIFERFYRLDPARSRAEGGTGLGLSIVKHLVESMGGVVTAESALGKGTTIRFWLPAGIDDLDDGARPLPGP